MIYINALELINTCLDHGILKRYFNMDFYTGYVYVYKDAGKESKEGWYLENKDTLAKELMDNEEACGLLIDALKEKGIYFKATDYSWMDDALNDND